MRVSSSRSKTFAGGEVGYFHPINGEPVPIRRKEREPEPVINSSKLLEEWNRETTYAQLQVLAKSLGVQPFALGSLGFQWAAPHHAWAIPMKDGFGNPIGIRLRADNGAKWAVKGSHAGIFLPNVPPNRTALIVEGATDAAAGLSLGYFTIGRPSCSGGMPHIKQACARLGVRKAIIIADNDTPGVNGAELLAQHLPIPVAALALPCKDLRAFANLGGTKELLDSLIEQVTWHQPQNV